MCDYSRDKNSSCHHGSCSRAKMKTCAILPCEPCQVSLECCQEINPARPLLTVNYDIPPLLLLREREVVGILNCLSKRTAPTVLASKYSRVSAVLFSYHIIRHCHCSATTVRRSLQNSPFSLKVIEKMFTPIYSRVALFQILFQIGDAVPSP